MSAALADIAAAARDPNAGAVRSAPSLPDAESILGQLRREMPDERAKKPEPQKPAESKAPEKPAEKPVEKAPAKPPEKASVPSLKRAEVKPVEPAHADDEIPEGIRESPKASENFKKILTRAKAAEARLKEVEAQSKQHASTNGEAELARLRQENEDLIRRVTIADITQHPRFQETFDRQIDGTVEHLKVVAGKEVGDKLSVLVRQPPSQYRNQAIREAVEELGPIEQSQIGALLLRHDELQQGRENALKEWKEARTAMQSELGAKEQAAHKNLDVAFDSVLKEAASEPALVLFQRRDGDDSWNQQVEERIALARHIFSAEGDDTSLARAAVWAAAAPGYLDMVVSLGSENEKLKEQIKKLEAAQPGATGGGGAMQTGEPKNFMDVFKREMVR